jgi:hypothetical protein
MFINVCKRLKYCRKYRFNWEKWGEAHLKSQNFPFSPRNIWASGTPSCITYTAALHTNIFRRQGLYTSFINRNTRIWFNVCVSIYIEWADTHKGKTLLTWRFLFLDITFLFLPFGSSRFFQMQGNKQHKIPTDKSDNWLLQVTNILLNIWWLHVSAFH